MKILLTGGAGYIGSHAAVVLSGVGHEVFILDNFCNSNRSVLERLSLILGNSLNCIVGNVLDTSLISSILENHDIDAVIHLAGLKAVSESMLNPIEYYANNVQGTLSLLKAMQVKKVRKLVFSSSATVYGNPQYLPIDENHPIKPTNAYGRTKSHVEEMLMDIVASDSSWRIISLRYFNPVGAHPSGLIGEDPKGVPNNLVPYIARVASGKLPFLKVHGNNYDTPDGTGVRDYIHVMDLSEGHLAALNFLNKNEGFHTVNLGTGRGVSVLEMLHAFEHAIKKKVPFQLDSRRQGDVASCYAKSSKALQILNWKTARTIDDMCYSAWKFEKNSK